MLAWQSPDGLHAKVVDCSGDASVPALLHLDTLGNKGQVAGCSSPHALCKTCLHKSMAVPSQCFLGVGFGG
jgi:hypothetical protein